MILVDELALKTGKTRKHVEYLLTRQRRASADLAKILAEITGLERRAWLWPDEFPNPLITIKEQIVKTPSRSTHSPRKAGN